MDNSAINHSKYRAAVNHFIHLVEYRKTKYYSNMVREKDNPKALWNSIKKVLHSSPEIVLPDHTTIKIAELRSGLLSTDVDPPVTSS